MGRDLNEETLAADYGC